jgi:NAD(P)-dependent dehydrogenase (short-subunit alcohol dehydrogenase family)
MTDRLDGKVALITGGASGIGRRTAEAFVAEGARVVLADMNCQLLDDVVAAIGIDVCAGFATDVTKEADVEQAVAATVERFGSLDIGVNCAGVGTVAPIHLHPLANWHQVLEVCLTGVFLAVKHESAQMLRQGTSGTVINVASINGRQAAEGMVAYCSAKAGVEMVTRVAALELGSSDIRVNAIAPGFVDTPMTEPTGADLRAAFMNSIPMGRPGRPEDIANAAVFLASAESSWVNGETLVVDGGEIHREYPRILSSRR